MATVPASGTVFEMVATAAMAVASITGASAFSGTAAMSAAASMSISAVSIFPAIGPVSIAGTAKIAVGTVSVTHPGSALIGDAITDILGIFGCCGTPNDCALSEAVKAVYTGLQQFYLSDMAKGVATNVQRQVYYFTGGLDSDIDGAGARLPDINVSAGAIAYGVSNQYSVQTVLKVVFVSPGGGWHIVLRPVSMSPGSIDRPGIASSAAASGSLVEWLEDSASTDNMPLFYEVFQYLGIPIIRVSPVNGLSQSEQVHVHYIPKAVPVTADDLTNGRAFDVQAVYVESWIMPLCRYAALSSGYFDAANAPLAASIRERYAETLKTLGLADLQQPNT